MSEITIQSLNVEVFLIRFKKLIKSCRYISKIGQTERKHSTKYLLNLCLIKERQRNIVFEETQKNKILVNTRIWLGQKFPPYCQHLGI